MTPTYDNGPGWGLPQALPVLYLISLVRRRRYLVGSVVAAGTTIALLAGLLQTPSYTATASVVIEPSWANVAASESVVSEPLTDDATIATQLSVIDSPSHAELVIDAMNLTRDQEFNPYADEPKEQSIAVPAEGVTGMLASWFPADWLVATGIAEERAFHQSTPKASLARAREAAITSFLARLNVSRQGSAHVLQVEFTSRSSEKAVAIANRTAQLYVASKLEGLRDAVRQSSSWLEGRLESLREELRKSEEAVERYRAQHQLVDGDTVNLLDQELSSYLESLIAARAELAQRQARLRRIEELRATGQALDGVPEVIASPLYLDLWKKQSNLLSSKAELTSVLGESHPQMQKIVQDLEDTGRRIELEIERIVHSLEGEAEITERKIAMLEESLSEIKGLSLRDRQASVRLRELERQAIANRQLYQNLLARYKESQHQSDIAEPRVRVIAPAQNARSDASHPMLFAMVGFIASSFAGVLLAHFRDTADRGIRCTKQLEAACALPCIALVPELDAKALEDCRTASHYALRRKSSVYAETMRLISSALNFVPDRSMTKVVQITSSVPGEGKTTLATSLGTVVAQSGARTLILDLDFRHPSVEKALWGEQGVGEESSRRSADPGASQSTPDIVSDPELRVDVLSFRGIDVNSDYFLHSVEFRALMEYIRSAYDFVVIDGPPVLGISDTRVITSLVDDVLVVVRWGNTTNEQLQDAMKNLASAEGKLAGAILSRVHFDELAKYGYGGVDSYYSQYRSYYQD